MRQNFNVAKYVFDSWHSELCEANSLGDIGAPSSSLHTKIQALSYRNQAQLLRRQVQFGHGMPTSERDARELERQASQLLNELRSPTAPVATIRQPR